MDNKLKKNCYNCKYLDYYSKESYEDSSPEGFFCNGREYAISSRGRTKSNCEVSHLELLQKEEYLIKSKRCCELKEETK